MEVTSLLIENMMSMLSVRCVHILQNMTEIIQLLSKAKDIISQKRKGAIRRNEPPKGHPFYSLQAQNEKRIGNQVEK